MRLILAASAALLLSSPAFAGEDIMQNYFGNTVISKTTAFESHTNYNADHTFTANYSSPMGSLAAKGTWSVDASNQLCRTFETPPPGATNPLCLAWSSHKVGDTWQVSTAMGSADISLVAGIK
jgi:hypothetical protein